MNKPQTCTDCSTLSLCKKLKSCPTDVTTQAVQAKETNPKDLAGAPKVSTTLVPEIAVIELAQAFRDGARKYSPYNWRHAPVKTTVYLDAMERHLMLYRAGQDKASDSMLSHLTHIMSGCAILLDAELNGTRIDDRHKLPDPGKLEKVLELYREVNSKPTVKGTK